MREDPFILLSIGDFIRETSNMTSLERGWFTMLILHNYDNKMLPTDIEKLAVIAKVSFSEFEVFKQSFKHVFQHLLNFKDENTCSFSNIDTIIKSREMFKDKRSNAGKLSVLMRFFSKHFPVESKDLYLKEFIKKNIGIENYDLDEDSLKNLFKHMFKLYKNEDEIEIKNEDDNSINNNPNINLSAEIFKNLESDFAKEIQSCINGRMPIILKKEIAGKKNTYFQLLKNLSSFQQTIKHQAKPLETNEAFETRIDLLIKNWLQEQRDGKIEQSWTTLSDFAQHALNYIRLQENKSKNGSNGNSKQNARPLKGFVETKDNDYNSLDWGKPLGH